MAFSPDSKTLASGSRDNNIILWNVATGQPRGAPLTGHKGMVACVAFSPDGRTLASGGGGGLGGKEYEIILWDVATGHSRGVPLTGHDRVVSCVAFSPDGKTLASGSQDRTIRLWDVDVQSWIKRACAMANRNLTPEEWGRYMGMDVPHRKTCPDPPGPEAGQEAKKIDARGGAGSM